MQVNSDQIELWLHLPVTQSYLKSLELYKAEIGQCMGDGGYVDSSSSDVTFAQTHIALGQQQGLETAMDYEGLLDRYGYLEEEKEAAA